jgi:hypothetical protein
LYKKVLPLNGLIRLSAHAAMRPDAPDACGNAHIILKSFSKANNFLNILYYINASAYTCNRNEKLFKPHVLSLNSMSEQLQKVHPLHF